MKLYMVPLAPNPTKVMLYLAERQERGAGLEIEQVMVNTLKGKHKAPEHLARHPFGTLPALELDDGGHLIESLTIIEYLEDAFPEGAILPKAPLPRARALEMERIVELKFLSPSAQYVHATNSPLKLPPDPAAAEAARARLDPAMDYLEATLAEGRPYLTGDDASIADFTLAAAAQFARFAGVDLLEPYPQLHAWDARFRERPAAKAVLKW